uniref:WH2 domain-containing protein n=1 Tax=Macrostomum lignano TaxID=282301 RepID=A0A1I8FNJ6_9PLAT
EVLPDKKLLNKASSSENLTNQNAAAADLNSLASADGRQRRHQRQSKPPTPTPAVDSDDAPRAAAKSKPPTAEWLAAPTAGGWRARLAAVGVPAVVAAALLPAATDDSPAEANDNGQGVAKARNSSRMVRWLLKPPHSHNHSSSLEFSNARTPSLARRRAPESVIPSLENRVHLVSGCGCGTARREAVRRKFSAPESPAFPRNLSGRPDPLARSRSGPQQAVIIPPLPSALLAQSEHKLHQGAALPRASHDGPLDAEGPPGLAPARLSSAASPAPPPATPPPLPPSAKHRNPRTFAGASGTGSNANAAVPSCRLPLNADSHRGSCLVDRPDQPTRRSPAAHRGVTLSEHFSRLNPDIESQRPAKASPRPLQRIRLHQAAGRPSRKGVRPAVTVTFNNSAMIDNRQSIFKIQTASDCRNRVAVPTVTSSAAPRKGSASLATECTDSSPALETLVQFQHEESPVHELSALHQPIPGRSAASCICTAHLRVL